ncbi:hypothetical protein TWF706_003370 [Orbilia oligospora]|nr:hypothetical protein TWF706_003370 [Orbilia oligospora]
MDPPRLAGDEAFLAKEFLEEVGAKEQDNIGSLGSRRDQSLIHPMKLCLLLELIRCEGFDIDSATYSMILDSKFGDPDFPVWPNILDLIPSACMISPASTPILQIHSPIEPQDDATAKSLVRCAEYAKTPGHEPRSKLRKGSKSYQCEKCPRSFSNLKSFGDHMRTEHNVQAFKCRSCGKQVARHDNLRPHEMRCKGLHSIGDKRSVLAGSAAVKASGRPEKRHRSQASDISGKTGLKTTDPSPVIPTSPSESDSSLSSTSGSDDEIQETSQLVIEVKTLKEELNRSNADLALLRGQVSKLVLECDLWKQHYLQLRLGDKVS